MKTNAVLITAVAALFTVSASAAAQSKHPEEAAVREALNHYLMAHATGDGAHNKLIFHPESKLFFIRDGQFTQLTSAEYIGRASGKPADDEAKRKRWIESVDITGNAAVGKIVLDYPNARLTDYMSLLKIDGKWMIVNKIFHSEPKAAGTK